MMFAPQPRRFTAVPPPGHPHAHHAGYMQPQLAPQLQAPKLKMAPQLPVQQRGMPVVHRRVVASPGRVVASPSPCRPSAQSPGRLRFTPPSVVASPVPVTRAIRFPQPACSGAMASVVVVRTVCSGSIASGSSGSTRAGARSPVSTQSPRCSPRVVRIPPPPSTTKFGSMMHLAPTQQGPARAAQWAQVSAPAPSVAALRETLADEAKLHRYALECFNKFDIDSSNTLSFEELVECMQFMNSCLGVGEFRMRDVMRFMRRFDFNSDGSLDREEFQGAYRHLLLAKLNEEEPSDFCRDMFLGRRVGQPTDHYDVVREVGKGSFGIVRSVLCKDTRAERVLKTVDKEAASKNGLPPKVVMEEIEKLKALDHPAVLRLFEYYADDKALHLVTDHLPGGELMETVSRAHSTKLPLTENWSRAVFHQVCEGVAYIHGKGVMHRDLKLENIMLACANPPEAIIIDVGLAELFPPQQADEFKTKAPTGSIPTMAPQVFSHSSGYKCDVWSLGCVLFGLVCKTPLWIQGRSGAIEVYPYPFSPPRDSSTRELQDYLRRQNRGPDLANTTCRREAPSARDLISKMLTYQEKPRPNMHQVLAHPWLKQATKDKGTKGLVLEPHQLDCLVGFQRSSALEEALLLTVASQLPLRELGVFRELFRNADIDHNGQLDIDELAEAMRQGGLSAVHAQEAARKIAKVGTVEFSRFVAALAPSRPDLLLPYMRDAFNRLDTNGDGIVTASELRGLFEETLPKGSQVTQTVRSLLEAYEPARAVLSFDDTRRVLNELCA